MQFRPATQAEIAADMQRWRPRTVRFEHWAWEYACRSARNGVAHRNYSSSKIIWRDGVACVKYRGDVIPLRATHFTASDGKEYVSCWTLVERENNTPRAIAA